MSAALLLAYVATALGLQVGLAVALALWRRGRRGRAVAPQAPAPERAPTPGAWSGWREFRVARREYADRACTLCSFELEPVDGAPLAAFTPGQFLTLEVPITPERVLTRCYSISDRPNPRSYRITVKRVPPPGGQPELPPGACSTQLHDQLQVGDVLRVKPPSGPFVLDPDTSVPSVLVAGGVGITPLLSMLRGGFADHPVYLFYGVRRGAEHGFRAELDEIARLNPRFHLMVVYSQPDADDVLGRDFHRTGHIDLELLRQTVPLGRCRFYVCGPPPMMRTLVPALLASGVRPEDVLREAFGAASVPTNPLSPTPGLSLEVTFRKSGRALTWDGRDANLLDFAERHRVAVESGCRSGSCGSCEVRVLAGTVHYAQEPDHAITPGYCLLCVGAPDGPLELEA